MSDTPETDKECGQDMWDGEPALISSDFARKLERERDENLEELRKANVDTFTLLGLIADIRAAVGDPEGKLMQDELVDRCKFLYDEAEEQSRLLGMSGSREAALLAKIQSLDNLANIYKRERDEAQAERDEWIARFRADEQLIKEAMIPHPENPEL